MKAKKIFISLLVSVALVIQSVAAPVALAAPELPSVPDVPGEGYTPEEPEVPDFPDNYKDGDGKGSNDTSDTQSNEENSGDTNSDKPAEDGKADNTKAAETPEEPDLPSDDEYEDEKGSGDKDEYTGDAKNRNDRIGDVEIETGDADGNGSIVNTGNTNASATPVTKSGVGGIAVDNTGNGSDSENTATISLDDESETVQLNDAHLENELRVESETGGNSASKNTGGDSTIKTGDANATGTIFNSVNTNVDGVMISEFNIIEDHVGDYVLDFEANCISGCRGVGVANGNNGAGSTNTTDIDALDEKSTFQANNVDINNELVLVANTGDNQTSKNTGGDNTIKTGDANVQGSVVNFANNNFAGNVIYGVVNIFGDLVGDILIPEEFLAQYGIGGVGVDQSGNGSGSTNTADIDITNIDEFSQFNQANIVNNLDLSATTGGNDISKNTAGDNSVKTGDADIDVNVVNIANSNVIGGDWWFVIVNEAGNWIGKIFGAPERVISGFMAASAGTGFNVAEDGTVTVSNTDNGSGSENTAGVALANVNTVNQENTANITNNIKLAANTGGNEASRNTGGDSKIETGDSNVVLNLVNFVNNNFVGGNVFMAVVNVFGNWLGDFVAPGAQKPKEEAIASENIGIGGLAEISGSAESSGGSSGNTNNSGVLFPSGSSSHSQAGGNTLVASSQVAFANSTPRPFGTLAQADRGLDESEQGDVLAFAAQKQSEEEGGIKINLAWLAVLVPAYFIIALARRRYVSGS